MRILLSAATILFMITAAVAAPSKPGPFVEFVGERAIDKLADGKVRAERHALFAAMLEDYLALDAVARYVAGDAWSRAEPEAREAFRQAFKTLLVNRFVPAFAGHDEARIDVRDVARLKGNGGWAVRASVRAGGSEPAAVTLRVIEGDDGLKVADVVTRGVSMALMLRQEYQAFLDRHDGDLRALTDKVREKARTLDE